MLITPEKSYIDVNRNLFAWYKLRLELKVRSNYRIIVKVEEKMRT